MIDCVKIFNTGVTNHSWVYDFMQQYDGYGGVRITWGPRAEIILDELFFERYPNAAFAVRDFCRKYSLEFSVLGYGFNDSQVLTRFRAMADPWSVWNFWIGLRVSS